MNYSTMKKDELKAICKDRKIKGITGKTKDELITMIEERDTMPVSVPKNEAKTNVKRKTNVKEKQNMKY